jgi:plasmid stabilization system protein ParE
MSLEIFYTPDSRETLSSVYDFIQNKFGTRAADSFVKKAEKTINLIAEYPHMFKASAIDENIRIGLITKQTSLFYRVTNTTIQLLFFWDNRQEPIPQITSYSS